MNLKETQSLLKLIGSVYPNFEVTKERLLVWSDLLAGEDGAAISKALKRYMLSSSQYPPLPGQLIEEAEHIFEEQKPLLPEPTRATKIRDRKETKEEHERNKKYFRKLVEELAAKLDARQRIK